VLPVVSLSTPTLPFQVDFRSDAVFAHPESDQRSDTVEREEFAGQPVTDAQGLVCVPKHHPLAQTISFDQAAPFAEAH
jgi:hypothetical protein